MEWSINVSRETGPRICALPHRTPGRPGAQVRRQKGRRIRPPAGDRCAVVTPAAGLHPRPCKSACDVAIRRCDCAVVVIAMLVDLDADRMPSFDQGSTVCVMTVQPPLEGGRPAAMAHLSLAAGPAAGALCDHIHPCRCEAGEAAHYGAAAAWRRCKLAAATAEPRSDCCTVASLCGITRSCAPLKVPYGAAAALCGRVVD